MRDLGGQPRFEVGEGGKGEQTIELLRVEASPIAQPEGRALSKEEADEALEGRRVRHATRQHNGQ